MNATGWRTLFCAGWVSLGGLAAGCWDAAAPPGSQPPAPAGGEAAAPGGGTAAGDASFRRVFTDITGASGLVFKHETGSGGKKLLPETLGAGAGFLDFDGDGNLDLFLVNSGPWPGGAPSGGPLPGRPPPACALFRGDGRGGVADVSAAAGANISLYGMGCSMADYDGDGDEDIYITAVGDNVLLRNDAGRFRDATAEAGVAGGRWKDRQGNSHPEWSTAAAWADFDRDGDLDLLVANYVEWAPELEIFTTLDGVSKAFTTPDRYPGLPCRLFLNDGGGKFADATAAAGLADHLGKGLGIGLWDFDGNGFLDVVVANDTRPNFLFLNLGKPGSPAFQEAGMQMGIAYDDTGRARAGMGIDIAAHANDGTPAVAIGNFSGEPMSLYRWGGANGFTSEASRAGIASATYDLLTFGVLFLDVDLDGALDLAVVNGHIEPDIGRTQPNQAHAQRPQLFQGRGDGKFIEVGARAGKDFNAPRVGRGLAAGDIDGDGDLDLIISTNGGAPSLLRNDRAEGLEPHWLRLRLKGKEKNTAALGAQATLSAGGRKQVRWARTGSSYLSQSEQTLTFGLGENTRVDQLEILWPSGARKTYKVDGVDRVMVLVEE